MQCFRSLDCVPESTSSQVYCQNTVDCTWFTQRPSRMYVQSNQRPMKPVPCSPIQSKACSLQPNSIKTCSLQFNPINLVMLLAVMFLTVTPSLLVPLVYPTVTEFNLCSLLRYTQRKNVVWELNLVVTVRIRNCLNRRILNPVAAVVNAEGCCAEPLTLVTAPELGN